MTISSLRTGRVMGRGRSRWPSPPTPASARSFTRASPFEGIEDEPRRRLGMEVRRLGGHDAALRGHGGDGFDRCRVEEETGVRDLARDLRDGLRWLLRV